jgi:N-acetylglucosamine transport system substrate-binding protein
LAADILRNRTLANDMPDIFDVNQYFYNHMAAIDEGLIKPLDFLYDVPCVDDPSKTIGDILNFQTMGVGHVNGSYYLMPDTLYTSGLWYDAKMFRDSGYEVPGTWDEFVALGDKAKADGKYLLLYTTKYGGEYFQQYWFDPLLLSLDLEAYGGLQNLKEDAWSHPAVRKALELTVDLIDRGYVDQVSGTLDIPETQMEFCNGNALFYACGSWLEAEMAGNWPEGFELTYLPFPPQNEGEPSYTVVAPVVSAVAATTENEDIIKEYYRYMLSHPETIEEIVKTTLNGLPIKGFSEKYGHLLPASVNSCWQQIDSGRVLSIGDNMPLFYNDSVDLLNDLSGELTARTITVDEYIDALNQYFADKNADEDVVKRTFDMEAIIDALKEYR